MRNIYMDVRHFTDGLGELKIYPGVYAKAGLNFEFGTLNSKIRALEAGGVFEYLPDCHTDYGF